MNRNDGDNLTVYWWWTPDCGAIHTDVNPVILDLAHCPVADNPDWMEDAK